MSTIPGIATNSANAYERKFVDQFIMLAQQTQDEVSTTFSVESRFSGEAIALTYFGRSDGANPVVTENQLLTPDELSFQRRWMAPQQSEKSYIIDKFTTWQMVADPSSGYMQRLTADLNIAKSKDAMASIFADVQVSQVDPITGLTSITTSSFPSSNQIAATFSGIYGQSDTGLTFDKLQEVQRLMFNNFVTDSAMIGEKVIVLINQDVWGSFLGQQIPTGNTSQLPAIYKDYLTSNGINTRPGNEVQIGDFTFKFTHNLLKDGSGNWRVPVFLQSGMKKGEGPKTASFRELQHTVQSKVVAGVQTYGFLRSEDYKVYEIKCQA